MKRKLFLAFIAMIMVASFSPKNLNAQIQPPVTLTHLSQGSLGTVKVIANTVNNQSFPLQYCPYGSSILFPGTPQISFFDIMYEYPFYPGNFYSITVYVSAIGNNGSFYSFYDNNGGQSVVVYVRRNRDEINTFEFYVQKIGGLKPGK